MIQCNECKGWIEELGELPMDNPCTCHKSPKPEEAQADEHISSVVRSLSNWEEFIDSAPKFRQRQDAMNNQLKDLYYVANKLGYYDAADYLRNINLVEQVEKNKEVKTAEGATSDRADKPCYRHVAKSRKFRIENIGRDFKRNGGTSNENFFYANLVDAETGEISISADIYYILEKVIERKLILVNDRLVD